MSVRKLDLSTVKLKEGVHYASNIAKYIVRVKKNGKVTTMAAFKDKNDAEKYYRLYREGEIM